MSTDSLSPQPIMIQNFWPPNPPLGGQVEVILLLCFLCLNFYM